MNYQEALAWLYGAQMRGIKLGLEPTRRLLTALGYGGNGIRYLHVAGTNGKGSVCAMLASICRASGSRTGLYTSPHLVSFRERIVIGAEQISEEKTAAGLSRIREIVAGWETHPTFFEITTALALLEFEEQGCETVVLETGLGGRFDSTNVVIPKVCVITRIDLDHQAWLGNSLAEIAFEKAGIIKKKVPVISAPQHPEAAEVLARVAAEQEAPLRTVAIPFDGEVALAGSHQKLNAALAIVALRAGAFGIGEEAISRGLRQLVWPGRFQAVGDRFILDGAHNPAAAERLAVTWREEFGAEKGTVVFGALRDKDVAGICRALGGIASDFLLTPVPSPRSCSVAELRAHLAAGAPEAAAEECADLAAALEIARRRKGKILVAGSLFLVGAALAILEGRREEAEISAQ